jgi:hypothetical protein
MPEQPYIDRLRLQEEPAVGGDVQVVLREVSVDLDFQAVPRASSPLLLDRRIPIVVGVTGHNDLREEDHDALGHLVSELLGELRTKYPDTPLIILSALAEGADRLVARVALRLHDKWPDHVGLVVPLPMKQALYETDFKEDASLNDFHKLLSRAAHSFSLPLLKGNTEENVSVPGAHRNAQYQNLGRYIARHCQILIALWDGRDSGRIGGTWEVVRFKMEGAGEPSAREGGALDTPLHSELEPAESGPVYQIVTPRSGYSHVEGVALTVHEHYPSRYFSSDAEAKKYYRKIAENINTFNKSASDPSLSDTIATSKEGILPEDVQAQLPANHRAILERYGVADALAIKLAGKVNLVRLGVHILALSGLVSFELFTHSKGGIEESVLLGFALGFFLSACGCYFFGKRRSYQDLYQDYRALAEGLRVQLFWCITDIDASVANHYLGKHRTELDWIRNALRNWRIPLTPPEQYCRFDLALKHWIMHQYKYFHSHQRIENSKRHDPWVTWPLVIAVEAAAFYFASSWHPSFPVLAPVPALATALIITATLLVSVAVASVFGGRIRAWLQTLKTLMQAVLGMRITVALVLTASIVYALLKWLSTESDPEIWHANVTLMIALPLAFAAVRHHYNEQMAHREHAKLYGHMQNLFARALRRMQAAESEQERQEVLRDLGVFALEENSYWVMIHRERPLEVPFG